MITNDTDRNDRDVEKRSNKGDLPGKLINPDDLDSKVNTSFDPDAAGKGGSLTIQESSDTDPNQVADKPTFHPNK